MEELSGYAIVIATGRIRQRLNKPLFGKPYLTLGQCLHLWGYMLQLGAVLGAKHAEHLEEFGAAFLGSFVHPTSFRSAFAIVAADSETQSVLSTTFTDFVIQAFSSALNNLDRKVTPDDALGQCREYATAGAALGALYPEEMRKVFERTHDPVTQERWELMRSASLAISPSQDLMSWEESQEEEDAQFMAYCEECCPSLYPALTARREIDVETTDGRR